MRNLLKIKLTISVICTLAIAEHGTDYVDTFWPIMALLWCAMIMTMSIVEDVYGL